MPSLQLGWRMQPSPVLLLPYQGSAAEWSLVSWLALLVRPPQRARRPGGPDRRGGVVLSPHPCTSKAGLLPHQCGATQGPSPVSPDEQAHQLGTRYERAHRHQARDKQCSRGPSQHAVDRGGLPNQLPIGAGALQSLQGHRWARGCSAPGPVFRHRSGHRGL